MENRITGFTEELHVRSYEINPDGRISMLEICNYLQETAGKHARKLGVAVDQLLEKGMTWVLTRLHVKMNAFPKWGELVRVETWPAEVNRLFAIRDFRVLDKDDKEIGAATTAWILINVEKKRPMRLPPEIRAFHPQNPVRALADDFAKMPPVERTETEENFVVRFHDLDLNRHANNAAYAKWILESPPAEIWEKRRVEELEIEYKKEGLFQEEVCARSQQIRENGPRTTFIHQVFSKDKNRELARGRTVWSDRE